MNLIIDSDLKNINQEIDAVILSNPMLGVKHIISINREVFTVISVPPGNILEFQIIFYEKSECFLLFRSLITHDWKLEKINLQYLLLSVISSIERNDIEMIMILDRYIGKQINNIYSADIPRDSTLVRNRIRELDELIDLQVLLQNRGKLRPALMGVYEFIGKTPVEA